MQTRSSDSACPSSLFVCLSVRPSVKRVNCNKTKEKPVQIFRPYEITFSLFFWEKEWLVRATPSVSNFGSTGPRWSKIAADFRSILSRSDSAVTLIKKSSTNINKKSTLRFPMSQDEHRTLFLNPQRGPKTQSVQNLKNKLRYFRKSTR